ncbi:MAG: UPF0175 family protein [Defluviitaleaceae bacterium]|nr:UPF0175 family protein [Defluviitaleaceae bacterium]
MLLNIPISEDIVSETEVKQAIAVKLYADGKLSLGKATEIAELDESDFMYAVGKNSVLRFETPKNFFQDILAYANAPADVGSHIPRTNAEVWAILHESEELDNDPTVKTFHSIEELMDDLENDEED